MRHLAGAGDIPTIFVVQGVTDLAFDRTAGVITRDNFETERAAMLFIYCELYFRFAAQRVPGFCP